MSRTLYKTQNVMAYTVFPYAYYLLCPCLGISLDIIKINKQR